MSNPLTPTRGLAEILYAIARSNQAAVPTNPLLGLGALVSPASDSSFLRPPSFASLLGEPVPAPTVWQWRFVRRRFGHLLAKLEITDDQRQDGETKQAGVRACLNRHYWGHSSPTLNSVLIGSRGKGTRIGPPPDIDILFLAPPQVYWRFDGRAGNHQSQLLQEVKDALVITYPQTTMRADGQVVVIPFNSTPIEVSVGFSCQDGSVIVCDTNDGGKYKASTSMAEAADLDAADAAFNGNARALARILKQWQQEQNARLKSFQLERLAVEFLRVWPFSTRDLFWYDWMVRDFFGYLISRANGSISMPGTGEVVWLGSEWLSRAQAAFSRAVAACENEQGNYQALAGAEWQEIFGTAIPVLVE